MMSARNAERFHREVMNSSPTEQPAGAELRPLVAELLVIRASGHLEDQQRRYPRWELSNAELKQLLGSGVGGVILLGGSASTLQQIDPADVPPAGSDAGRGALEVPPVWQRTPSCE